MCSTTFSFEYKFWFQTDFRIAAKLDKISYSFSWEHIIFFYGGCFRFRESVSWLALSFLCRGIWSLLGGEGVSRGQCRKYPKNTFLLHNYFVSNLLFWWRDHHFWLPKVYLACGDYYCVLSSTPESSVCCSSSWIGSGCCLSQSE